MYRKVKKHYKNEKNEKTIKMK